METIELKTKENTTKVFVDGKEIGDVLDVVIEKHGWQPITVEIKATVKEVLVCSL